MGLRMANLAFLVLFASLGAVAAQYGSPAPVPTPQVPSLDPHTSPQNSSPSYTGSPSATPAAAPSVHSAHAPTPTAAPSYSVPSSAPVPTPQGNSPRDTSSKDAMVPSSSLDPHTSPQNSSPSYTGSPSATPAAAPSVHSAHAPTPTAAPSYSVPSSAPVPTPQDYPPSYIAPVVTPTPSPPSTATPTPPRPTPPPYAGLKLKVGFYSLSCPLAEYIIREVVWRATSKNPGIGAGLIRLHFHDCFVQGCDASVLLDPTPANPEPEKLSPPNFPSLRGFEVIDLAKAALEKACPGRVSCADILAFAARDAAFFLSRARINYPMPAGRLDGRVSLSSEALQFLPPPFFNLPQLIANFKAKNLDEDDLVVLSGAHTIGVSHCSSFTGFLAPNPPPMEPAFAAQTQSKCALRPNASSDPTVMQDVVTPDQLDSQYYRNILRRKVLFASDAALLSSNRTAGKVLENALIPNRWEIKFARAMVKMAAIELKTAANGEIRRTCRAINN